MKLLYADDEAHLQQLMSLELPRFGHEVTVCPDGLTAVAALERNSYDCLIVDLDMPGMSGIQVIAKAKELDPAVEAVVLTGKSTMDSAIAAVKLGAFDYMSKPFKMADLGAMLQRVAERREWLNKYRALKMRLERVEGKTQLIGDSVPMQRVRSMVKRVAPTESTVLILGETGTGKELVARSIHEQSLRAEKPFVAVNCGALPENLIESELFGHRKGAFTGADEHRQGLFEVADGGTLFLDEIGELPKSMQAKLLRVLECGEVRRVGDNSPFVVDVRVLCATHRNLEQMVIDGEFRQDLLFRINTFEVSLPALRERSSDVPALVKYLLARMRPTAKPDDALVVPEAMRVLEQYAWPGNVRELANVIEHAAILCETGPIELEHLPSRFNKPGIAGSAGSSTAAASPGGGSAIKGPHFKLAASTLRELEMQAIHEALERHKGNKPKAAEELGISLKTLYNKLNQAGGLEQAG
ncbi:MAG: sigma-54-dependent Fis family transcriptional regulator [Planctomycetes bacterium]|nr:sigma-54-dependent Fis family transcriptional regulator [Planctomycetota bacterium]